MSKSTPTMMTTNDTNYKKIPHLKSLSSRSSSLLLIHLFLLCSESICYITNIPFVSLFPQTSLRKQQQQQKGQQQKQFQQETLQCRKQGTYNKKHHVTTESRLLFSNQQLYQEWEINDDNKNNSTSNYKKIIQRHKYWIVLVDDEESIRTAVGNFLYENGYQITACSDSDSVIQVVTNSSVQLVQFFKQEQIQQMNQKQVPLRIPDVMIIDIRMPQSTMDGLQLVEWIRSYSKGNANEYNTNIEKKLQNVPIILLTAKGLTQDRIVGYNAGANFYLSKPFNPEELLSIIDNAIQRKQQHMYSTSTTTIPGTSSPLVVVPSNSKHVPSTTKTTPIYPSDALLLEMKNDMESIKSILKESVQKVVKVTDVYLTLAERDVLHYISLGYTNIEIAKVRNTINNGGVTRIINNLYRKTQTSTRTELIRWAIETGYISKQHQQKKHQLNTSKIKEKEEDERNE